MRRQTGSVLALLGLGVSAGVTAGQMCTPEVVGERIVGEFRGGGHGGVRHGDLYLMSVSPPDELRIYDISGATPQLVSSLPGVRAYDIAIEGALAVATGLRRVSTVDLTTPAEPALLGTLGVPGPAHAVVIDDGIAYVTGEHGLATIDFSDPANLRALHIVSTPGTAGSVVVHDGVAWVGDGEEGLRIFDVSDPRRIREIGGLTGVHVSRIVRWRDTLIFQTAREGLLFAHVGDPAAPEIFASMKTPSYAMDLALDGTILWVSAGAAVWGSPDLIAIDISDVQAPVEIGRATIQSRGHFGTVARGLAPEAGRLHLMSSHFDGAYYDVKVDIVAFDISGCANCPADCDGSGALDFFDFLCFQNLFAAGDPRADCDGSGELDVFDFLCFQNEFAAGCS